MDNYTEMDHIKREEDQAVVECEIPESTSHATVYRDIPFAQDINTLTEHGEQYGEHSHED